jgi:hypothetical protein
MTYVTHPWVIADKDEACLGIYLPTAAAQQVQLNCRCRARCEEARFRCILKAREAAVFE